MTCFSADLLREADDADAQADALHEQIEAARMKVPADVFGAKPYHVSGFEAHSEQARSLRVRARDLRAQVAASSSVAAGENVQSTGTPPLLPSSSRAAAISTIALAKAQPAQATDEIEVTAQRIFNSDKVASVQSELDEIGIVALRIASADIGAPDEVDAIAARISAA